MRGAIRSTQRIIDVGGNLDAHVRQARIKAAQVDTGQIGKRETARWQGLIVGIEKACAQCREHAAAAVVGCAATDGQNHATGTRIQCRRDQLARTCCAGHTGVALCQRQ
ncbi:hypothetical protein Pgy4_30771, partial [Pseudomonas savastanoi pv. glycinea str. race 4]